MVNILYNGHVYLILHSPFSIDFDATNDYSSQGLLCPKTLPNSASCILAWLPPPPVFKTEWQGKCTAGWSVGGFSPEKHSLLPLSCPFFGERRLLSICKNSKLDTNHLCRLLSIKADVCRYTGGIGVKFSHTNAETKGLIPGIGASGQLPMSTTGCVRRWEASEGSCPCRFPSDFFHLVRAPCTAVGWIRGTECAYHVLGLLVKLIACSGWWYHVSQRWHMSVCSPPQTVTRTAVLRDFDIQNRE